MSLESLDKVQSIVMEQLGLDTPPKLTAKLINDLGADSLGLAEIGRSINKEFEIRISEAEYENLVDIASIVALVKKKTG